MVVKGREKEIEQMAEHGVFVVKPLSELKGKKTRAKWLDEMRQGPDEAFVRSRLVATEVNTYQRDD
eukprot:2227886-Lingulodinium_polyedra.AAC.1